MGCVSNRAIMQSTLECDNLMEMNILMLRAIEIMSLKGNRQGFAMYIIFIHKKTEKYYSQTKKHRECWKKCLSLNSSDSHLKKFQMMQDTEKNILLKSNLKFSKLINQMNTKSAEEINDICSLMIHLEKEKNITCQLKPLYSKFEDFSEQQLNHSISLYDKLTEDEEKIIHGIRKITLDKYYDPLNIIYYKESFETQEKEEYCKDSLRSTTAKNSTAFSLRNTIRDDLENYEMDSSSESFNLDSSSESINME